MDITFNEIFGGIIVPILGIAFIVILIIFLSRQLPPKCPHCGKKYSLKITKNNEMEYLSTEDVKHDIYGRDNKPTGMYYTTKENVKHSKKVPVECKCKNCGHIFKIDGDKYYDKTNRKTYYPFKKKNK